MAVTITGTKPVAMLIVETAATWTQVSGSPWMRTWRIHNNDAGDDVYVAHATVNGDGGAVHANDQYDTLPASGDLSEIRMSNGRGRMLDNPILFVAAAGGTPEIVIEAAMSEH